MWSGEKTEFIVLAGDEYVENVNTVSTVVGTGQTVEVEGGRFECCLLIRMAGITEKPYRVPGFLNNEPCLAFIEVSHEVAYAPGMGSILTERRERAIPVGYPDSVVVEAVYRAELVKVEKEQ